MSSRPEPKPIGDLSICVAIDKSGSTWGGTLGEEIKTVEKICSLRSPRNENPVRLLPWCDKALPPICLPKELKMMRSLESDGGTSPKVLYTSEASLSALSSCGIWFLLTDGEIEKPLVRDFAIATAELGLHGLACIIVVFGSTLGGPPADCNISVGIATYAVVPDCLFLFQDTSTGSLSILQAKGCFKELLPRSESSYTQPVINKYTAWGELPHISYEDLRRIQVAPPKKLALDELALQEDLTVRMQDLYSGAVDKESVGKIIRNQDNLKSIVMAETIRGNHSQLQSWLATHEMSQPEFTRDRPDVDNRAQKTVARLLECLETGETDESFEILRRRLRDAHAVNRVAFEDTIDKNSKKQAENRRDAVHCRSGSNHCRKMESHNSYGSEVMTHDYSESDEEVENALAAQNAEKAQQGFTSLPGFQRDSSRGKKRSLEFVGRCMLCHASSVLAILLKMPPDISTPNFPRKGSLSPLAFPLAMSGFAETDVVSFFLSCDSCALYLVRNFKSPHSETITAALPLTSLERNQDAWLDCLEATFKGRFRKCDLSALFVAILDKKIMDNKARKASPQDIKFYGKALKWTKRSLLAVTTVPLILSSSFSQGHRAVHRSATLLTVVSDRALLDPAATENVEIAMLRYPFPGFMVIIRLMIDQGYKRDHIYSFLFQRLMYHLTEVYLTLPSNGKKENLHEINKMLSHNPRHPKSLSESDSDNEPKSSVSIEELIALDLLDQNTLATFRTAEEFEDVEKRIGPATAVYLHHLSRHGGTYVSPVDCFNALKVKPSVLKVISKPLATSEGLSKDLFKIISRGWNRGE